MAYDDVERSIHGGSPVYLYQFTTPNTVYRYAAAEGDITYAANVYTAQTITSDGADEGDSGDGGELLLAMPASLAVAQEYTYIPPRSLDVEVFRVHTETGDALRIWSGPVVSLRYNGAICEMRSLTVMQRIRADQFPRRTFHPLCGNVLGDAACGVNIDALKVSTTVSVISGFEITVASDGGAADGYLNAGQIVRTADGERRLIIDHTGDVLTIKSPFKTIAVSDAVDIFPGCTRTPTVCRDKFGNMLSFSGQPGIPLVDPYRVGMKRL